MMRLIFARHGESVANVEPIISNRDLPHPLTAKGRQQANALADRLAENSIVAIYSSPILRAQGTAQIIAQRLGLVVETSAALREFDCGVAEGRGDDEAWRARNQAAKASTTSRLVSCPSSKDSSSIRAAATSTSSASAMARCFPRCCP